MANPTDKVRAQIQREMRDLRRELTRLEAALRALDDVGASSNRRPSGTRRAPRGANRTKILNYLEQHPSARPKEIAAATGIAPKTVSATLSKLRANGTIAS